MIVVGLADPPQVAPTEAKYVLINNFGNVSGWYASRHDAVTAKMILTQTLQPQAQKKVVLRKVK
jgi:hypothetical protein